MRAGRLGVTSPTGGLPFVRGAVAQRLETGATTMNGEFVMNTGSESVAGTSADSTSRPSVRLGNAIKWLMRTHRERRARRRAAAHLRSWSDYQLKDIGLSRGQIEFAVQGLEPRRRPPRPMP